MLKFMLSAAVICLLCAPYPALAQTAVESQSNSGPTAEGEYQRSVNELRAVIKVIRTDIRAQNAALAVSLGKTDNYDEAEVKKRYAELTAAHDRLANVELEAILLYKKQNPDWKPATNGSKVVPADTKKSRKESASSED